MNTAKPIACVPLKSVFGNTGVSAIRKIDTDIWDGQFYVSGGLGHGLQLFNQTLTQVLL